MRRGGPTKLGLGLIVVIVLALVITGVVWAGKKLSGSSSQKTAAAAQSAGVKALTNVDKNSGLQMLVRGRITAAENQRSYSILITPSSRTLTIFRGYDGDTLKSETLTNTTAAYTQLSFALNRVGMMNERQMPDAKKDLRGICAGGKLYQFQTLNSDKTVESLFITSCDAKYGTFAGNLTGVRNLFLRQIPDAEDLLDGLNLL
ncbi:MAG: hypothetical protein LBM73_02255 [Candidatus Nomurabacteria bacterium]|jgi:hypothetical protein|nr:hypothetical protein [Candidatus Nomurabacteria bacterium]